MTLEKQRPPQPVVTRPWLAGFFHQNTKMEARDGQHVSLLNDL